MRTPLQVPLGQLQPVVARMLDEPSGAGTFSGSKGRAMPGKRWRWIAAAAIAAGMLI
jgi:hypothetical protein